MFDDESWCKESYGVLFDVYCGLFCVFRIFLFNVYYVLVLGFIDNFFYFMFNMFYYFIWIVEWFIKLNFYVWVVGICGWVFGVI